MKLYIWEGDGISAAYHDDGTLVVAATNPEEAREVIRRGIKERAAQEVEFHRQRDEYLAELRRTGDPMAGRWTSTERGKAIWALASFDSDWFDGHVSALDRDPDRIVELDEPKWVAFNGGGYD